MASPTQSLGIYNFCNHCHKVQLNSKHEELKLTGLKGETVQIVDKLFSCNQCKLTKYCTEDCRKKDFEKHKIYCFVSKVPFSEEMLNNTILFHFEKDVLEKMKQMDAELSNSMRYGYLIIAVDSNEKPQVNNNENIYALLASKLFLKIRSLFLSEMKKNQTLSEARKEQGTKLGHLLEKNSDKFIVSIQIARNRLDVKEEHTAPIGHIMYSVLKKV